MRLEIKRARPKRQKARSKTKKGILVILLACIVAAMFLLLNAKTSTMLREVAQSELESIAFDIVGRAVEKELSNSQDYSELVHIEYTSDGRVSAIKANMQQLNMLKLRIMNKLSEEMFIRTEDYISIPLGNLTGIDFFTGLGPRIKFKIMWVTSVNADFSNTFTSAGINQTRHQIMLDFAINVGMMLSGREVGVDVGTSVCVAETVIVGDIPDVFMNK